MDAHYLQKPGVEEWLHWANVVLDRLTDCVHIYKKPPNSDVFMPEAELQHKNDILIKLLHRLNPLVDESGTPSDSITDAHSHDERVIAGLVVLLNEAAQILPWLSVDMQKLLKSPWMNNFPNKTAESLFGGKGDETQGIGSGYADHGRLPAALAGLLESEREGDSRLPRVDLLRHGEPRRHDNEGRQRWMQQNTSFLRSAGRVE